MLLVTAWSIVPKTHHCLLAQSAANGHPDHFHCDLANGTAGSALAHGHYEDLIGSAPSKGIYAAHFYR